MHASFFKPFFPQYLLISLGLPFSEDERKEIQVVSSYDIACFVCLFCYALVCYINPGKSRVVLFLHGLGTESLAINYLATKSC